MILSKKAFRTATSKSQGGLNWHLMPSIVIWLGRSSKFDAKLGRSSRILRLLLDFGMLADLR
jgi:hypothetical protein